MHARRPRRPCHTNDVDEITSRLSLISCAGQRDPILRTARPVVYRRYNPVRVVECTTPHDPDKSGKARTCTRSIEDPYTAVRTNSKPLDPATRSQYRRCKRSLFSGGTEGHGGNDHSEGKSAAGDSLAISAVTRVHPKRHLRYLISHGPAYASAAKGQFHDTSPISVIRGSPADLLKLGR